MGRHTITVSGQSRSDPNVIIGYDPPLRTYFLQAFQHEITDDPALWLGTHDRAFEILRIDLHNAATARGYDFMPLPPDIAARLTEDKVAAAEPHDADLANVLKCRIKLSNVPAKPATERSVAGFFVPGNSHDHRLLDPSSWSGAPILARSRKPNEVEVPIGPWGGNAKNDIRTVRMQGGLQRSSFPDQASCSSGSGRASAGQRGFRRREGHLLRRFACQRCTNCPPATICWMKSNSSRLAVRTGNPALVAVR